MPSLAGLDLFPASKPWGGAAGIWTQIVGWMHVCNGFKNILLVNWGSNLFPGAIFNAYLVLFLEKELVSDVYTVASKTTSTRLQIFTGKTNSLQKNKKEFKVRRWDRWDALKILSESWINKKQNLLRNKWTGRVLNPKRFRPQSIGNAISETQQPFS